MGLLIIILIGGAIFGFLCRDLAEKKGHSTRAAFWVGFFFGIFAWIGYKVAQPATRECPSCHEPNYFKRTTCKMCGTSLPPFKLSSH